VAQLTLVIGNRNYSSWSLRAWTALKHLGVAFDEVLIPLDQPDTHERMDAFGPSGRVPVLRAGDVAVWDSLAICEYAAELTGRGWPRERAARAVARSVAAEMHSGFQTLRTLWPMNARARNRRTATPAALSADVERIDELWNDCRHRFGAGGPWLFGAEYGIADAMYAPVVLRFTLYAVALPAPARAYADAVLALPALAAWIADARTEREVLPQFQK